MTETENRFDVFVSSASQDSAYVRQLVRALRDQGLRVWYDEGELRLGDSVLRALEDGLEHSRYFVLVMSPAFFKRPWAQFETGVALGRSAGKRHILPVYLGVEPGDLRKLAPILADTTGINAMAHPPNEIAMMIRDVVAKDKENRYQEQDRLTPNVQ